MMVSEGVMATISLQEVFDLLATTAAGESEKSSREIVEQANQENEMQLLYCAIGTMISSIIVGFVYQVKNRKYIIAFWYTLLTVLLVIRPFWFILEKPQAMILVRCVMAVCIVSIQQNPLINNYIKKESRGKGNALYFSGNCAGKLIAVSLLLKTKNKFDDPRIYYWVCAGLVFVAGLTTFIMMLEPLGEEIKDNENNKASGNKG